MTELPEELRKAVKTGAQIADRFIWDRNRFDEWLPSGVVAAFLEGKRKELKEFFDKLKEFFDKLNKEQALKLQNLEYDIKICKECTTKRRCYPHEQSVGQWYGFNQSLNRIRHYFVAVLGGGEDGTN